MAAGDDNWDLSAVVRSCNSGSSSAAAAAEEEISALSCLASLTFEDDPNDVAFSFSDIAFEPDHGLGELHQAFMSFLPSPVLSGPELPDPDPTPPENKPIRPQPGSKVVALQPRRWQPLDFSNSRMRRIPKSKRRKIQPKRTVCLVTVDNLTTDQWAWRKYGQKPIKGSPYPRNYYRCSSSKGCGARKQVERSNDDPNNFIITYTGDHSHPRPSHWSSLAGIPRNCLSPLIPIINPTSTGDLDRSLPPIEVVGSCPSPVASPITWLNNDDDGDAEKERAMNEHNVINSDDDDDDNDILIPNLTMRDEIFVGFEKLGYGPRKRPSYLDDW